MNDHQVRRLQRMLRRVNDLSGRMLHMLEEGEVPRVVMATGPGSPPRGGMGGGRRVGQKMAGKRADGGGGFGGGKRGAGAGGRAGRVMRREAGAPGAAR